PKITKTINTFISDCKDLKQSEVITNVYKQFILNKKSDYMLKELSELTNLTYVTSVKPKNNKIRRMGDSISGIYYYNAQRNNRVYNMKFWLNEKNQIAFFRVYYEY
ncbi:MAG: hypothetical protein L0Y76_12385, partial [Ignavibacteria bacterium]|nr:hypothetical protein [Ignavibacteria bacterium]